MKSLRRNERLIAQWELPSPATLGSAVRARGILLEVRSRLSFANRKRVDLQGGLLVLRVPADDTHDYRDVTEVVEAALTGIEDLPVIPRELEDILAITSTERHRWLKDGRLQSVGTRTVKLRGRARKITFHVFDPRQIEDILDQDLTSVWRAQDALAAADNRRRAAGKAALTRAGKRTPTPASGADKGVPISARLKGWEEFDLAGLLR